MMEFTGADEMEKYRKYIQKRRVSPVREDEGDEKPKENDESGPAHSATESVGSDPYNLWSDRESNSARYGDSSGERMSEYSGSSYIPKSYNSQTVSLPMPRRADTGLYKKLYGGHAARKPASSYSSAYRGSSASARTEVEDNRVTLFAVKLIKQALACFAILGIIILMQSRPDMKDALAVVKKQVIEINVQPQSIYEGIKDLIDKCTQALGGSP